MNSEDESVVVEIREVETAVVITSDSEPGVTCAS